MFNLDIDLIDRQIMKIAEETRKEQEERQIENLLDEMEITRNEII